MPSYLFKADGDSVALPVTAQGEAWSWLELGVAGPSFYLWLINLFSRAPVLQLSTVDDFPRAANGVRPVCVDVSGNVMAQELDGSDAYTGRIYNVSRTGVIRYTDQTAGGVDEFREAAFDSSGRLWGEVLAGDPRFKVASSFNYAAHTRTDAWSGSIGAGAARLMVNAGRIAGRVYATQGDPGQVQQFGYFDAAGTWVSLETFSGAGGGIGCVGLDDCVYVGKAVAGELDKLAKYDADGVLVGEIVLTDADPNDTRLSAMVYDGAGRLWIQGVVGTGASNAWCVNAGAFTVEISGTVDDATMVPGAVFNSQSAVALMETPATGRNIIGIFQFNPRIDAQAVDLGNDVIKPLSLLSGLTEAEINVTSLVGTQVIGYVVASRSAVREMIEPLMTVFLFDAVESDDTVKYVLRGGSAVASIAENDLGAQADTTSPENEFITTDRQQEMELPVEVNLAYMSSHSDYEASQQPSRRLITLAKQSLTLSIPVVLTDDQARQAADAIMFGLWTQRVSERFSTSRKFERYEPTDVINVTANGRTRLVRLMGKNFGANGVLDWEAVVEEPSVYTQFSIGIPAPNPNSEVPPPSPSIAVLLDIPMLRADDNDPGFYFSAYGVAPENWQGVNLSQSKDGGAAYSQLANASLSDPSIVGAALTALGPQPALFEMLSTGNPNAIEYSELFDEINTVDIQMASGELSSATRQQVLNGANVAALAGEVFQFRTATLLSPGLYRLSGLLRGRLGTERDTVGHEPGDLFVLLNEDGIRTVQQTFGELNAEYLYKPVTLNSTIQQTPAQTFTNTGRRRKPLAPWGFAGGRDVSGNLLLKWKPRTRFAVNFGVGVQEPSGETLERYALYIPSFSEAVRVITTDTPEAVYTAAQQVADYGSLQAFIEAEVCQVSPEFGLGYLTPGVF